MTSNSLTTILGIGDLDMDYYDLIKISEYLSGVDMWWLWVEPNTNVAQNHLKHVLRKTMIFFLATTLTDICDNFRIRQKLSDLT